MNRNPRLLMSWLIGGIAALLSACSNNDTQNATLQVRLTDAPGDYQAVNVDIQDVQINAAEGSTNSGWKSLDIKKGVYNLLKFTNGLDTLLGSVELPAGRVSQIRLVLGPNNSVKVDGHTYNLTTPSAQQSGLKILVKTDLQGGVTYKITLDFDAARSIVKTGNGTYILKPVIRSLVEAQTGAIKGIVSPAASRPAVFAIQGIDTLASAYADTTSGKFLLKGLAAGSYTISFAPKTGYQPKAYNNVSVTVGSVTDMGTVEITP